MKYSLNTSKLLVFCFFLFSISLNAQTDTLINRNKEGGFELGSGSFTANGWSVAADNGSQVNQWTANRGAQQGFSGNYCAYITNQPNLIPPPNRYTPQQSSTVHFYRDIRFSAGKTSMNLSFMYLNSPTEAPLRVALVHRDSALTSGITLGLLNNFNYNTISFTLDPSVIGNCDRDTSWRLVFSWTDPSSGSFYQPPPAIDDIQLTASTILPAFRGTDTLFTIDKTRETVGTNFKNFEDAINAINSNIGGICNRSKPLVFNVTAGQVFEEITPAIVASGTANAPIIFQKSGAGANPVLKPKTINIYETYGFSILGADYWTFDGIDVDGRGDSTSQYLIRIGYAIENASSINGSQNIVIKNCSITLDKRVSGFSPPNAIGVLQSSASRIPSTASGTNSKNRFLNLKIQQCDIGIYVRSYPTYPDSLLEIGSTDPSRFMVIGTAKGDDISQEAIRVESVVGLSIHHVISRMPFFVSSLGTTRIYNNKIITSKGNTTLTLRNGSSFNNSDGLKFDVFNNFFSMPRSKNRDRIFSDAISVVNSSIYGENAELNFYNNSVFVDESMSQSTILSTSCFALSPFPTKTKLVNNVFVNATHLSSNNKGQYCIVGALNENSLSNYNAFWRADSAARIGAQPTQGIYSLNLTEWRNAHGAIVQDVNSIETNPLFLSDTDLHAYGLGIDGKGTTPPNGLAFDIDNEPRNAPFDIGADQFMRQITDLAVVDLIEPNDASLVLCENRVNKVKVLIKNLGAQPLNFAQNAATVKIILTKPSGRDSFSMTISTGTLAVDSTKIIELTAFTPDNYGSYFFQTSISTVGDANKQNDSITFERRFLTPKPLPLIEAFEVYSTYSDWTFSAGVGFLYRGKTGNGITAILSRTSQNKEFQVAKVSKITDATTFLNFDYRIVTGSSPSNQAVLNTPNWGKIEILGSIDCGATFSILKTIDSTNHRATADFQTIKIPLSIFVGSELVLKVAISGAVSNDIYVDFDNFYIGTPCRQLTGMDSIVAPMPLACVGAVTNLFARVASPSLFGTKWQWQYSSDSMRNWLVAPDYSFSTPTYPVTAKPYPIFYRMKTICATDSSSRLSNAVLIKPTNLPTVVQVPYSESFENWQTSACMPTFVSNDIPSNAWYNKDNYGNMAWRRQDEGSKASWQNAFYGAYVPQASSGQYSARFHSSGNSYNQKGIFDLNIDLSGASDKQISFDYINTSGADGLKILLSSDGGMNFQPIDPPLSISTTWRRFKYNIPSNGSATSVLRFEGNTNLFESFSSNNSDIGLDSLTIENITIKPTCTVLASPLNGAIKVQDDELLTWQAPDYATGYRIKIGTTANGSDVLPLTDLGTAKQYRYPNFYDYQKTYFATLEPYNKIGAAQGCPSSSFTITKNPNFGGGRDGLDSLQPLSGGYTFANSTLAAANAPNGKSVYNWINPQNHTEVATFDGGDGRDYGYYYISDIGFNFPFYHKTQNNRRILLGINGIIDFEYTVPGYYPDKTIPSSTSPDGYGGIIAPCHADLYRGTDSRMYFKLDSNQFVATWWHFYESNSGVADTSAFITFQIILTPDSNIKFQYNADESSIGRLTNSKIQQTALIGIEGVAIFSNQRGIQYRNKGRGARIFDAQNKSLAISFESSKGDLAATNMTNPNPDANCWRTVNRPVIQIQNRSSGTLNFARTPATVQIKMTGARNQTIIQKVDTGSLAGNAYADITFLTPLSMDTSGTYDFEIIVKNSLDENATNDTFRTSRTISSTAFNVPYSENFNENSTTATSWSQYYSFIQNFRSGGNGGSFLRMIPQFSQESMYAPMLGRMRKGDYLAFDYRIVREPEYQPDVAVIGNDWGKITVEYSTDCGYNFQVLDSITPASHTSTLYWRQKAIKIPDSLAGQYVRFRITDYRGATESAFEMDNFYIGKACDSTTVEIGNISAPPSVCLGDTARAGLFERVLGPFMQYKWQYSSNNGTSWSSLAAAEGNNYILPPTFVSTTYRVIGTCTLNQISDTTAPRLITAFTPKFSSLPYSQSFENWETSNCNYKPFSSLDIPDKYWLNLPQRSSSSWRRNDQGNLAGWNYATEGGYTPTGSQGSYSARIHTRDAFTPIQGSLNLFVDMSDIVDKTLAFDYRNASGNDSLRISWSTDSGITFTPLSTLGTANRWTPFSYSLTGGSETSIIRFEGICPYYFSLDDIGLDNVRVFANNFAYDAAVVGINSQGFSCQNSTQPLVVKIRNAGIDAMNLAENPLTINVSVSGAASASFAKTLNTGSLETGEVREVIVEPNFKFAASGNYNFDVNLSATADLNAVNNTFKTQSRVVSETTIPFFETFEPNPNLPAGWLGDGGVRIDTSYLNNGSFSIGFIMAAYFNPNFSTKGGSFILPKIGVVRADDVLSFDTRIARYNMPLPNSVDWGSVEASISADCGQTWTTVWQANRTNFNSSVNFSNIRIPLSNWVGKSIVIRFTAVYKEDNYTIGFDNFRVDKKCVGAPTITPITGSSAICYGEKSTLQTTVGSGVGLNWIWQKQDSTSWTAVDTNKVKITTPSLFSTAKYRVVATCLLDSTTSTSAPFTISVNQPIYAPLPYRQDFESWQSITCAAGNTTQALPDASWVPEFYSGNGSWRRNDNGNNAGWSSASGAYTPLSTSGNYSARFHSTQAAYDPASSLDLYVDLSQTRGTKYLSFDFINTDGTDGFAVFLSKDGGKTFNFLDRVDQSSGGWQRVEWAIYSDSSRCVLRFYARGYPFGGNTSDIGLDNLTITNKPMPNCIEWISPTAYASNVLSDVVMRWRGSAGAKGYKIKIGTTQYGSEFQSLTDIGRDTFFKPSNKFNFLATYYASVIAYDSLGNARSNCFQIPFTIQRNPNFGGGANGNDPAQPMAGGYFFANSTSAAAAALPSQPRYAWIDPLSNSHATVSTWTSGNSNNGSFTLPDIGFNFSFFGNNYRNNIYVNSNGAIHFGAPNTSTGEYEYIPSSSVPNNLIAACWMDLAAGTDGKVYYGKSENGGYVITWWHYHDVEPNGTIDNAEYITFQVMLNQNGTIKIQFNDAESTANNGRFFDILNDALIGIEDANGNMGIQYRNNGGPAPMFSSPLAIAFALNNALLPVQNPSNTEGVSVGDAFPNPSSNQFAFDFYTPQKMLLTIQLNNSLGQSVWSDKYTSQLGWQQKTVDWNNLPAGIYWLVVSTEQGQRFVQRVMKN